MDEAPRKPFIRRYALEIGICLGAGILLGASYLTFAKFLSDRENARDYQSQSAFSNIPPPRRKREVKTYTPEDLEKARKEGTLPKGLVQPPQPPQPPQTNAAAVQRSLKTIEEINKINQMNQRLLEQQRRMQQR